jgi:superkiller protein 3
MGRYQEAIIIFEEILKIKTDDYQLWHKLGSTFKGLGELENAYFAYFNAAKILFDLRKYEEAFIFCDNALKVKPSCHEALYQQGNTLFNLGRYEQAITLFNDYLKIQPGDYKTLNNRGNALFNI